MTNGTLLRILAACSLSFASHSLRAQTATDWSATDRALGRAGADQPGGVHKFSFPRSDLQVTRVVGRVQTGG